MRLSSISSQDSGFTSQDTLFLQPGPPPASSPGQDGSDGDLSGSGGSTPAGPGYTLHQGLPGPPMSDRPHTISSAYEKGGHQRPSLQPYTFNPPELSRVASIPEEEEGVGQQYSAGAGQDGGARRPPVPQRGGAGQQRPSLPGKTEAALAAKQALQSSGQPGSMPSFHCSATDMGESSHLVISCNIHVNRRVFVQLV